MSAGIHWAQTFELGEGLSHYPWTPKSLFCFGKDLQCVCQPATLKGHLVWVHRQTAPLRKIMENLKQTNGPPGTHSILLFFFFKEIINVKDVKDLQNI